MNKDQKNYQTALKFFKSLWYILFDVPYKFLRDWVIFGRVMLFLVRTFWFVKIKRKKNSDSDVTFCYILKKFIWNMRNLVLSNLLRLQIAGPNHLLLWNNTFWAIDSCTWLQKPRKYEKMRKCDLSLTLDGETIPKTTWNFTHRYSMVCKLLKF